MLEVTDLTIAYGRSSVVRDVSFKVGAGQLVALLGGNGVGKTTILRTLSGLMRARAGSISLMDTPIAGLQPHEIVEMGLIQVPEGRKIFPEMTVMENLKVGAHAVKDRAHETLEEVLSLFPRLAERAKQLGGTLSGGEQQMLAVGRALMSRPKLLMLDEPSLGLAPVIVDRLYDQIATLKSRMTILLVEQNTQLALDLADYGYVLQQGRIMQHGTPEMLRQSDSLKQAYFGE
jgi:branched-chain amino acid transport system ATP-binding protein